VKSIGTDLVKRLTEVFELTAFIVCIPTAVFPPHQLKDFENLIKEKSE